MGFLAKDPWMDKADDMFEVDHEIVRAAYDAQPFNDLACGDVSRPLSMDEMRRCVCAAFSSPKPSEAAYDAQPSPLGDFAKPLSKDEMKECLKAAYSRVISLVDERWQNGIAGAFRA